MSSTIGTNGTAIRGANGSATADPDNVQTELLQLNLELKNLKHAETYAKFHGDDLIGDRHAPNGLVANLKNSTDDFQKIFTAKNMPTVAKIVGKIVSFQGVDMKAGASLVASMSNDSKRRRALVESQVKSKYAKMLHPPLTYLGDAFQYRAADGKFNNVLSPHLGQAGAPYAKTVPSKTHQLGALPDPGDLFDRLMARQKGGRESSSGLSSMLIYHATIIIHDIFRTNDNDKNISDSSSYLDLSPLYGYTMEMQRKIRDDRYKLGLLKPDTFAEDRLLRQPPGVCIMLVMYNRYHNYAATQLRRINENGRFSVPRKYDGTKLEAVAKHFSKNKDDAGFDQACADYHAAWKDFKAAESGINSDELKTKLKQIRQTYEEKKKKKLHGVPEKDWPTIERSVEEEKNAVIDDAIRKAFKACSPIKHERLERSEKVLEGYIPKIDAAQRKKFEAAYDAAWDKLDDDLFNTARLITCGMYIQVAIHDYLRALMGFHQWNTNFTLDPRLDIDHHNVSRGIGNQVTVEFNLLYRFHCAISVNDEEYTKKFMTKKLGIENPDELTLEAFMKKMKEVAAYERARNPKTEPWETTFGINSDPTLDGYEPALGFDRNPITGLFDDQKMVNALIKAMDDPISNFGPRNVPKSLRAVEIMGILQARKWEVGTLNDFRDFFGMPRHESFESITKNVEIQNALRDLYDHPDKVELYPGIFCESDEDMGLDPGPSDVDSALWSAIFSDAITLVRSDRFYTTDWNTNSLTSWGMKEVTPDDDVCKSSVFHRLLQRAFPGWFPYNSVQFFHPFYTRETNARFAHEQGYGAEFRISTKPKAFDQAGKPVYDVSASAPLKPWKPIHLVDAERIAAVLEDKSNFVHPAFRDSAIFPKCFEGLFKPHTSKLRLSRPKDSLPAIQEDTAAIQSYFANLMRGIIKRESVPMNNKTLQIDATRDFAIPVVTQYVADFLGFGHLIRNIDNPKAPHSENEIYQHIANCQVFMSYNSDETKLLKRRKAFTKSIEFLHSLVLDGYIGDVNRLSLTRYLFGAPKDNPMRKLGYEVAERVVKNSPDINTAAAIMVFVGLHTACNSVLAFTCALNRFLQEMYNFANPSKAPKTPRSKPKWLAVQELAFTANDPKSDERLQNLVQEAERKSIKLPMVRTALENKTYNDKDGNEWKVEKDHTVVLDIFKANEAIYNEAKSKAVEPDESAFLGHKFSAVDTFADYQPKHIADVGVTAMIKVFAQMRNARRGHDSQGRVKKVQLDASSEGYANYMAPMRIQEISKKVEMVDDKEISEKIYTKSSLRPATDTFLTAEWDEMVPFPNTWKIRFDGFGKSNYVAEINGQLQEFGMLREPELDDDAPPYYQPQGASHTGGTFADVACVCSATCPCATPKVDNKANTPAPKPFVPAEHEPTISTGCGMGGK